MKNILIIRSANFTTLDSLNKYLSEKYLGEDLRIFFLAQKNTLDTLKEKFPKAYFFVIDEIVFNYINFKRDLILRNELKKNHYDEIYIPSSSGAFDDFMDVMLIAATIKAQNFVFYSFTEETYETKLSLLGLLIEKNLGELVYLIRLVYKITIISLRYVFTSPYYVFKSIFFQPGKKSNLTDSPIKKKVCIISTCHDLYDRRIYEREALTLKEHGYEPTCIVISDRDETGITKEGIPYIKVKPLMKKVRNIYHDAITALDFYTSGHRLSKETYDKLYRVACVEKYDIYHFHDLYINSIGPRFKRLSHNPKVIYDVHESYPAVIRDYPNLKGLRHINQYLFSYYIDVWEKSSARNYDFIITVEDTINKRFKGALGFGKADIIYNYPKIDPNILTAEKVEKEYDLIYCGGISTARGAMDLLNVVNLGKKDKPDLKLIIIGPIFGADLEPSMRKYIVKNQLEKNVIIKGRIPFSEVYGYHQKSKVGLILLHSANNHKYCIPSKLFEYMMNGVPVVGTAMYHVQRIINQTGCGRVVKSINDTQAIWDNIYQLLTDTELYDHYSNNAKEAIKNIYIWERMAVKLIEIYNKL